MNEFGRELNLFMAYSIDTAAAIRRLEEARCDSNVAIAIVDTFKAPEGHLVSKDHLDLRIDALEAKIEAVKNFLMHRLVAAQNATGLLVFALIKFFT